MATVMATIAPKSRSRGSGEKSITAKPPTVVSAEAKNARPVWAAATSIDSSGE